MYAAPLGMCVGVTCLKTLKLGGFHLHLPLCFCVVGLHACSAVPAMPLCRITPQG